MILFALGLVAHATPCSESDLDKLADAFMNAPPDVRASVLAAGVSQFCPGLDADLSAWAAVWAGDETPPDRRVAKVEPSVVDLCGAGAEQALSVLRGSWPVDRKGLYTACAIRKTGMPEALWAEAPSTSTALLAAAFYDILGGQQGRAERFAQALYTSAPRALGAWDAGGVSLPVRSGVASRPRGCAVVLTGEESPGPDPTGFAPLPSMVAGLKDCSQLSIVASEDVPWSVVRRAVHSAHAAGVTEIHAVVVEAPAGGAPVLDAFASVRSIPFRANLGFDRERPPVEVLASGRCSSIAWTGPCTPKAVSGVVSRHMGELGKETSKVSVYPEPGASWGRVLDAMTGAHAGFRTVVVGVPVTVEQSSFGGGMDPGLLDGVAEGMMGGGPAPEPGAEGASGVTWGEGLVMGSLDASMVRETYQALAPTIVACGAHGDVTMKLVIDADGSVSNALVKRGGGEASPCLVEAFKGLSFPPVPDGGLVIVEAPMTLP